MMQKDLEAANEKLNKEKRKCVEKDLADMSKPKGDD